jgi:DNA-binding GntR family transcriptional regulator
MRSKSTRQAASTGRAGRSGSNLAEKLAGRIVEDIRVSTLPPGTHPVAQTLAEPLEVSRTPIMRALEKLQDMGLVEHAPNRVVRVAKIAPSRSTRFGRVEDRLSRIYFGIAEDRLNGPLANTVSARTLQTTYDLSLGEVAELLERIVREGWAFSTIVTTPQALEQSYRFRITLEPAALLEPTYILSRDTALRAIDRAEALLRADLETMPSDQIYENADAFHELVVDGSGNPFFLESLQRINRMRRLFNYHLMGDRSRYPAQICAHIRIIRLLIEGRNVEAADALGDHLVNVLARMRVTRVTAPHPI